MVMRPSFSTLMQASRADGSVASNCSTVTRRHSLSGPEPSSVSMRDRHDRPRRQLRGDIRFRFRQSQPAIEAAAPHRRERIALQPLRPRGEFDLFGMRQFERQLRGRRMTPDRFDLQAPQHDFLQPGRIVAPEFARRIGIAPQPPLHAAQGFALAERPHAGGEEIQAARRVKTDRCADRRARRAGAPAPCRARCRRADGILPAADQAIDCDATARNRSARPRRCRET